MLRFSIEVKFRFSLITSITLDSSTEIVILALGTHPASIRKIEGRVLILHWAKRYWAFLQTFTLSLRARSLLLTVLGGLTWHWFIYFWILESCTLRNMLIGLLITIHLCLLYVLLLQLHLLRKMGRYITTHLLLPILKINITILPTSTKTFLSTLMDLTGKRFEIRQILQHITTVVIYDDVVEGGLLLYFLMLLLFLTSSCIRTIVIGSRLNQI